MPNVENFETLRKQVKEILAGYGINSNSEKFLNDKKMSKMLGVLQSEGVDFHMHSSSSSDGFYSVENLLEISKQYVSMVSITDHNTVAGIDQFADRQGAKKDAVFFNNNGLIVVPGVEMTCKMSDIVNIKNRHAKFHLLVYAPDRDENTNFMKLVKMKQDADVAYAMSTLLCGAKNLGIVITKNEAEKIYNSLMNIAFDSISIGKTMEILLEKLLSVQENYVPSRKNNDALFNAVDLAIKQEAGEKHFEIELCDIIKLAHESGAICILAHPHSNLPRIKEDKEASITNKLRAIDLMLDAGLDGFERMHARNKQKKVAKKVITRALEQRNLFDKYLVTDGSDFHRKRPYQCEIIKYNKSIIGTKVTFIKNDVQKIGESNQDVFNKNESSRFIEALISLQKKRNDGFKKDDLLSQECDEIMKSYEEKYRLIMAKYYPEKISTKPPQVCCEQKYLKQQEK